MNGYVQNFKYSINEITETEKEKQAGYKQWSLLNIKKKSSITIFPCYDILVLFL